VLTNPDFCGWLLTPYGIMRSPTAIATKVWYKSARAPLSVNNWVDAYAVEIAFTYRLAPLAADYLSEVDVLCLSWLLDYFHRRTPVISVILFARRQGFLEALHRKLDKVSSNMQWPKRKSLMRQLGAAIDRHAAGRANIPVAWIGKSTAYLSGGVCMTDQWPSPMLQQHPKAHIPAPAVLCRALKMRTSSPKPSSSLSLTRGLAWEPMRSCPSPLSSPRFRAWPLGRAGRSIFALLVIPFLGSSFLRMPLLVVAFATYLQCATARPLCERTPSTTTLPPSTSPSQGPVCPELSYPRFLPFPLLLALIKVLLEWLFRCSLFLVACWALSQLASRYLCRRSSPEQCPLLTSGPFPTSSTSSQGISSPGLWAACNSTANATLLVGQHYALSSRYQLPSSAPGSPEDVLLTYGSEFVFLTTMPNFFYIQDARPSSAESPCYERYLRLTDFPDEEGEELVAAEATRSLSSEQLDKAIVAADEVRARATTISVALQVERERRGQNGPAEPILGQPAHVLLRTSQEAKLLIAQLRRILF